MEKNNDYKDISLGKWFNVKSDLRKAGKIPRFKEGDLWWCGCGENVGVEMNGKDDYFARPVLVYKKLSKFSFVGIFLTSRTYHNGSWYVPFTFHGKESVAVLCQIRTLSVKRLYNKMGEIDEADALKIKNGFRELYE